MRGLRMITNRQAHNRSQRRNLEGPGSVDGTSTRRESAFLHGRAAFLHLGAGGRRRGTNEKEATQQQNPNRHTNLCTFHLHFIHSTPPSTIIKAAPAAASGASTARTRPRPTPCRSTPTPAAGPCCCGCVVTSVSRSQTRHASLGARRLLNAPCSSEPRLGGGGGVVCCSMPTRTSNTMVGHAHPTHRQALRP